MPESKEKIPQKKIVIKELSLSEAWDTESQKEIIILKLEGMGLYPENLLFRGFDASKLDAVKKYGIDNYSDVTTWCSTEEELISKSDSEPSAIQYALQAEISGLIVYDKEKLEHDKEMDYEYRPKSGLTFRDAVLVVFLLT